MAVGNYHALMLLDNGQVYSWGDNDHGQLGDGTTENRMQPQLIEDIPGRVLGIAAGTYHSLAFLESGEVYGWGDNDHGQVGGGLFLTRNKPQIIKGITGKVKGITTGAGHTLALLDSGEVYGWGHNNHRQLGNGTTWNKNYPELIKGIPGKAISIAAGFNYSLLILESGEVFGWGFNKYGQLGDGTAKDRKQPQLIYGIPGKAVKIVTGSNHSLVLLENGEVYGWGSNNYGQLGDGTTKDKNRPQLIASITERVVNLAAGYFNSLVVLESGKVYEWGWKESGQLGKFKLGDILLPQLIKKVDRRNIADTFNRGGWEISFAELDKKFREIIGQEIKL